MYEFNIFILYSQNRFELVTNLCSVQIRLYRKLFT